MIVWEHSVRTERVPTLSEQLGPQRLPAPCWEGAPSTSDAVRQTGWSDDDEGGPTAHCVVYGPEREFSTTGFGDTKLEACDQAFENACAANDCSLTLEVIDGIPTSRFGVRPTTVLQ